MKTLLPLAFCREGIQEESKSEYLPFVKSLYPRGLGIKQTLLNLIFENYTGIVPLFWVEQIVVPNMENMIKRILVANRGEIAVRVMRSCREMEIESIAIFSEADRTAKHVLYADEAYCVGGAASKDSYLNIMKIS